MDSLAGLILLALPVAFVWLLLWHGNSIGADSGLRTVQGDISGRAELRSNGDMVIYWSNAVPRKILSTVAIGSQVISAAYRERTTVEDAQVARAALAGMAASWWKDGEAFLAGATASLALDSRPREVKELWIKLVLQDGRRIFIQEDGKLLGYFLSFMKVNLSEAGIEHFFQMKRSIGLSSLLLREIEADVASFRQMIGGATTMPGLLEGVIRLRGELKTKLGILELLGVAVPAALANSVNHALASLEKPGTPLSK